MRDWPAVVGFWFDLGTELCPVGGEHLVSCASTICGFRDLRFTASSNTGYCVAGRVAEAALGDQSFEKIAQDALFRPLGMNNTSYAPTSARPFILVGGSLIFQGPNEKRYVVGDFIAFIVPPRRPLD
ncbi:MAG: hypothetical protein ACI9OD_005145 [Limisphaerales bacterium]